MKQHFLNTMLGGWQYLNGKKTVIGAGFLFASCVINHIIISEWGVTAEWVTHLSNTFDWFGMGLTGVGFTHKGIKLFQTQNTDK